jgi:anti-sigma B factor antagonist
MEITVEGDVIRLEGDLDVCSARMVDAREVVSVFDVSGVTFMDCAGIGALMRARDRAHAEGKSFSLEGVGEPVARVLEATHLDGVLRPAPR